MAGTHLRRPGWAARAPHVAIAALSVASVIGCASGGRKAPPAPPPQAQTSTATTPTPPPPTVAGYDSSANLLAGVDSSPLKDKRIVLDPGHGGFFRGALGVNGLTEAEVNLGVALNLWGLLQGAGAQVLMTRTDDRDYLTPQDSTLRADLEERVRRAEDFHPDLFLSIHHNADARGAHNVNETQTYYKLGDEGPSLDLAQALHRRLVGHLGITPFRLMPGNYFVLRQTRAPAVLTEASYITNPAVEQRLALAAKQRLEAQALFLGLIDFFATPGPEIAELHLTPSTGDSIVRTPDPRITARVTGPFDVTELLLDDAPVASERKGGAITARPTSPLGLGSHRLELRARLSGARAARPVMRDFIVVAPAAKVALLVHPGGPVPTGATVAVEAHALDARGELVPDSLRVRLRSRGARPADTTIVARGGTAWAYFRAAAAGKAASAGVGFTATLLDTVRFVRRAAVPAAQLQVARGARHSGTFAAFLVAEGDSATMRGVTLALPASGPPKDRGVSPDGFYWCVPDEERCEAPVLRGFRPVGGSGEPIPERWSPRLRGALFGRRIVLDPEGGGEDAAGVGPAGTRAAALNLEAARVLRVYLEAAGARVTLTREGDYAISEVERVQNAERAHPERYLRISLRAEDPQIGYYFSSAPGRAWATRSAAWLERLGVARNLPPREDAQYAIQQTSCPAIVLAPLRVDRRSDEARLLQPGFIRRMAYAALVALAEDVAPPASPWEVDSLTVTGPEGAPSPRALIDLGGFLHQADASGVVRFVRTEPGALEAREATDRHRIAAVLLDSDRGRRVVLPPSGE